MFDSAGPGDKFNIIGGLVGELEERLPLPRTDDAGESWMIDDCTGLGRLRSMLDRFHPPPVLVVGLGLLLPTPVGLPIELVPRLVDETGASIAI